MAEPNRKLAAILSADVAGYGRLMQDDEAATVATLQEYRAAMGRVIERHKGRVVNAPGDNILAEFASAVEAVRGACEIQQVLKGRNLELAPERRMEFRIGVNLGDVIAEADGTIYGDGVNIAARMEALADPGGICISNTVFESVEGKLDFGFDFLGEQPVKNIAKPVRVYRVRAEGEGTRPSRGWRPRIGRRGLLIAGAATAGIAVVVAGVSLWWAERPSDTPSSGEADSILALPTGPSIAVLPFVSSGDSADDIKFSEGLTDGIITGLSRSYRLMVASRSSAFQYKGKSVDIREVGSELDVKYVMEGTAQRSGNTLRVTAQLLDADSGAHVWSETYDRDLGNAGLFEMQDEITRLVVGSIASGEGAMWQAELQKLLARSTEDFDAYDCVVLSIAFYNSYGPKDHARARDCLEASVEKWPAYQPAWSELAWLYLFEDRFGANLRPEPLKRALEAAQRAIDLSQEDHYAYWVLAMIRYHMEERLEPFHAAVEQALALNPHDATMVAEFGTYMAYSGDWDRGLPLIHDALSIQPRRWMHFPLLLDHYRKGEYDQALIEGQKASMSESYMILATVAATYGQLGQTERAQDVLKEVLIIQPDFANNPRYAFRKRRMPPDLVEALMDGLRKAGFEVPPADN